MSYEDDQIQVTLTREQAFLVSDALWFYLTNSERGQQQRELIFSVTALVPSPSSSPSGTAP